MRKLRKIKMKMKKESRMCPCLANEATFTLTRVQTDSEVYLVKQNTCTLLMESDSDFEFDR